MARSLRILVADDDDMVRMVMRTVLAFQGYEVDEAADGQEAIEKYTGQSGHPDLVMVDQNMPGLSGAETLAQLRQLNPELKAVLLSGGVLDDQFPDENLHMRYLPKPFINEELLEIVGSMLGRNQ